MRRMLRNRHLYRLLRPDDRVAARTPSDRQYPGRSALALSQTAAGCSTARSTSRPTRSLTHETGSRFEHLTTRTSGREIRPQ